MMDVIVDGSSVQVPDGSLDTIADVIGSVSSELDTSRRVVKVFLDGEDITGVSDRHLAAVPHSGRLEVTTEPVSKLAVDTLESIDEFHSALFNELSRAADEFRLGSFELSNEIFARCVDGLEVLISTTFSVATLLQIAPENIEAGERHLSDLTTKISEILDELIEAQTNRDSILIADLIEYELQALLEEWQLAINFLRGVGTKA